MFLARRTGDFDLRKVPPPPAEDASLARIKIQAQIESGAAMANLRHLPPPPPEDPSLTRMKVQAQIAKGVPLKAVPPPPPADDPCLARLKLTKAIEKGLELKPLGEASSNGVPLFLLQAKFALDIDKNQGKSCKRASVIAEQAQSHYMAQLFVQGAISSGKAAASLKKVVAPQENLAAVKEAYMLEKSGAK